MSSIGSYWRPGGVQATNIATFITRIFQILFFSILLIWIVGFLGGFGFSPTITDESTGANDTSKLFNWHPFAMTFGFIVCMGEALLSYKSPLINLPDRQHRKAYHFFLHTIGIISIALGLTAAISSHTAKRPDPIPNFYSTHSYLGLFTLILLSIQYYIGLTAYLWPTWTLPRRQALSSYHIFFGLVTFTLGMVTIAVGLQEKSTFIQAFSKPHAYDAILKIPAMLQIILALYGISVMFHFIPTKSHGHGSSTDGSTVVIESAPLHMES